MNIIIVGCGKVGRTLAEQLSREGHDLVVVDVLSSRVREAASTLDIMGIVGNGSSFHTQLEAGIATADILIAVTGSDELNLLCCLIAKKGGNCHTIARVRDPLYNTEIAFIKESMGISMIINPELTTAREMSKLLRFPSAIKIDSFAKGRVELLKFRIKPQFGLDGCQVSELISKMRCDVLVCAVEREDSVTIPNGTFRLKDNDIVSVVASHQNAAAFFKKIKVETHQVKNTLIVGGGTIAYYLAKELLDMGIEVRMIEQSLERCEALSELLPKAVVVQGDGTDQELLLEEGLVRAESVVAVTNMDEENLFINMFAKKHSDAKLIAKVNRLDFTGLIEELDIGSIIYPKYLTADYILQYVRAMGNTIGSNVETLYQILDGRAEALEFSIREESEVTGIPLQELKLRENLLLCCINRHGKILIPRGQDTIENGDTVIVVTSVKGLKDIRDILKK